MESRRFINDQIILLLGILLCLAIYWPGLDGPFLLDDLQTITENRHLRLAALDMRSLEQAAWSTSTGPLMRPISMASFAMNYYLFGESPVSFKATNLIIHILNGICIYILTTLIFSHLHQRHHKAYSQNSFYLPSLAAIISVLWLIHPINLTGVLYVVQRMTSLASLFMLLGAISYLIGRPRKNIYAYSILTFFLPVFFTALAVLAKENGVLLIVYLLVIEVTIFRFKTTSKKRQAALITFYTLTAAAPAIIILSILLIDKDIMLSGYAARHFSIIERVLTETRVIWMYLHMILTPSNIQLSLFHDDIPISSGLLSPPSTTLSIIGIIGLILSAIMTRRSMPVIALGIMWYLLSHIIESTILPLEIAFEHRNYLASYGALLAAIGLFLYLSRDIVVKFRPIIIITLVISYSLTTYNRAEIWSSATSFAIHEAENNPGSARAAQNAHLIHHYLALAGNNESRQKSKEYLEIAQKNTNDIFPDAMLYIHSNLYESKPDEFWLDSTIEKLKHYPLTMSGATALDNLLVCIYNGDCIDSRAKLTKILDLSASQNLFFLPHFLKATYHANALKDYDSAIESIKMALLINSDRQEELKVRNQLAKVYLNKYDCDNAFKEAAYIKENDIHDHFKYEILELSETMAKHGCSK